MSHPGQSGAAAEDVEDGTGSASASAPADAGSAPPDATAIHQLTLSEGDTLRTPSFATGALQQPPSNHHSNEDSLRLSSFTGFAADSVATLSTGGALADLAVAAAASQDGYQPKTVQQLKQLRHLHTQQTEQQRGRSAPAVPTALLNELAQSLHQSDSMASACSAGSDMSGRSDGEAPSGSPLVRPKAIRAAARQNSAPHATASFPGSWQLPPGSTVASSAAAKPAAGGAPPLRSAASAPDQLMLSPRGLSPGPPSGRTSPRQRSPTRISTGAGAGAFAAVDRKGAASAPLIARSSSVSSGEVCTLMAVAAQSEMPSGLGGGLSRLSRGRSISPQFGAGDVSRRSPVAGISPTSLQMPIFASRPSTPPSLAATSNVTSATGAWGSRDHMIAMELGSVPGSLEALAAQWQLDFAAQQQAAEKRRQEAGALQQQLAGAQQRQQQEQGAFARQQEAAARQHLNYQHHQQQHQQQEVAARLQQHLQEQQQREPMAYLSAAQLQHPASANAGGGMWPDGGHPAAMQQQGFAPPGTSPPAGMPGPDVLRQLAAQQGGWGAAGGGGGGTGGNMQLSLLSSGLPFGADPQLASSLQWYELQRQQRQQEAERQQQEHFARLLLAQQQQNAAQQHLLNSMRDGMPGGGPMQGAQPHLQYNGGSGGSQLNFVQLAGSAPALTASMQAWMQQQQQPISQADGAAGGAGPRKRSSSGELDAPAKRPSGDGAPRSDSQVCAQCGETNTPTWRRAGGQLLCNACGLRRYRAMARSDKKKNGASPSPAADAQYSPP